MGCSETGWEDFLVAWRLMAWTMDITMRKREVDCFGLYFGYGVDR